MAWLIRMAGLRDLRRHDGLSDLLADVLGDEMSDWYSKHTKKGLADRIEQLERELAAEKALADQLYENKDGSWRAYRKARGL